MVVLSMHFDFKFQQYGHPSRVARGVGIRALPYPTTLLPTLPRLLPGVERQYG